MFFNYTNMKTTINILLGAIISSSILKGDGHNGKIKLEPVYLTNVAMYLPREEKTKLRQVSRNGQTGLQITKTNTKPIYTEKDALALCEKLLEEESQASQTMFNCKYKGVFNSKQNGDIEITVNGLTGIVTGNFENINPNKTLITNPTITTASGNTYSCGDIELQHTGKSFLMKEYLIPGKQVKYPEMRLKVNQQNPDIRTCYLNYNKKIVFTYPFDETLCKEIVKYKRSFSLTFCINDIFTEEFGNDLPHTNGTASVLDLLTQGELTSKTAKQIMDNNAITIHFYETFYIPNEVTKIDYNGVRIITGKYVCMFGHRDYPQVITLNMNCVENFSEDFWGQCSFPNIEHVDFSGLQTIPRNFGQIFPRVADFPNLREISSWGLSFSPIDEIKLGDYNIKLNKECFRVSKLRKINLGGTKTIPYGALSYCQNLKHVIAKEVTKIEDHCFLESPIEVVLFPKVKFISPETFMGTPQLEIIILPNLEKIVSQNIIETLNRKDEKEIKGAFCHYSSDGKNFINNPKLRVFIPKGTQLDRCYFTQNNTEEFISYPTIFKDNIIYLSEQEIKGSYILFDIMEILPSEHYPLLVNF